MRLDRSAEIIAQLRRLSDRELRLTLGELKNHEREQVLALIEQSDSSGSVPAFETLVGLSPWLLKAIDSAKVPTMSSATQRLTPAARKQLLNALDQLASLPAEGAKQKGRTDGTFFGRMVERRKARLATP